MSVNEYIKLYDSGKLAEPALDTFFMHDRAVRESGLDTTYRLEGIAADIATIDLNSQLFKYEVDIANAIRDIFDDSLDLEDEFQLPLFPFGSVVPVDANIKDLPQVQAIWKKKLISTQTPQTSAIWFARAARRQQLVDHYSWNAGAGMYFDHNTRTGEMAVYETVGTLWPLWSGIVRCLMVAGLPCLNFAQASTVQAAQVIGNLWRFEGLSRPSFVGQPAPNSLAAAGGLVPGTQASRGPLDEDSPDRQYVNSRHCETPY